MKPATRISLCLILGLLLSAILAGANSERKYGVHTALEFTFGVQSDAELDAHVADLVELGVQVARVGVNWWQIEPGPTQPAAADWQRLDKVVDRFLANDIEPLLVILGSPEWANGVDPAKLRAEFHVPELDLHPAAFAAWLTAYEDFVRRLVERYKDRGGQGVRHWELWNEPNHVGFWLPQPEVVEYAKWAKAVEQVIKSIDETAEVAMGSLLIPDFAFPGQMQIAGREFLQGIYDEGVFPEIVSVHPYDFSDEGPDVYAPGDGINTFQDIETIRDVMLANCQAESRIWITEIGWADSTGVTAMPTCNVLANSLTEAEQAAYLERALAILHNRWSYVTRITWFWDKEREGGGVSHPCNPYALIRLDGTERLAGQRFRDFVATRGAAPEVTAVSLDDFVLTLHGRRFDPSSVVDLRRRDPGWTPYAVISGAALTRSTLDGYQILSLTLTASQRDLLLGEGLRAGVINDSAAADLTSSNYHTLDPAPPAPVINNAGAGCQDGYCLWIVGTDLPDLPSSFIDISTADGTFLDSYTCNARPATFYGYNLDLADPRQEHHFREGFTLHVVHDSNLGSAVDSFSISRPPITDPLLAPDVSGAGTGCGDRYCLWIAGSNFGLDGAADQCPVDNCYVDVTRTDGTFLTTYEGPFLNKTQGGFTLTISDPVERHYLREEGIRVQVVNDQQNQPTVGSARDAGSTVLRPTLTNATLFPEVTNAGTGCADRYCLWIAGLRFGLDQNVDQCPVDTCYVDITRIDQAGQKIFLGTYDEAALNKVEGGFTLAVMDPLQRHYLREEGLRVGVVNDKTDTLITAGSKSDFIEIPPRRQLGVEFEPVITSAGTSCEDHYCLRISGTGFAAGEATLVVITRNDSVQTYLATFAGEDLRLETGIDGIETIEMRIADPLHRHYLRTEGLRVVVVNDVVSDFAISGSKSDSIVVLRLP